MIASNFLLFLISPLTYLIMHLRKYSAISKNAIWLFVVFFGLTYAVGVESKGQDILSYHETVKEFATNIDGLRELISYCFHRNQIDFMRYVLAFFISRITTSFQFMVLIYSAIFGFYYSRSVNLVIERSQKKKDIFTKLCILGIFLIIPFWYLNGFRFWTAAMIFIYYILCFFLYKKHKYLFLAGISVFFHFAFLAPLMIVLIWLLVPKKPGFLMIGVALSFFFNQIDLKDLSRKVNSLNNNAISIRTGGYLSEEYSIGINEKRSENNFYERLYERSLFLANSILVFYIYFANKKNFSSSFVHFFSFVLSFLIFSNLCYEIPSGSRFMIISGFLVICSALWYNPSIKKFQTFSILKIITIPLLVFYFIVVLRIGLYAISINTLFGNPLSALILFDSNVAMNDIIKNQ